MQIIRETITTKPIIALISQISVTMKRLTTDLARIITHKLRMLDLAKRTLLMK